MRKIFTLVLLLSFAGFYNYGQVRNTTLSLHLLSRSVPMENNIGLLSDYLLQTIKQENSAVVYVHLELIPDRQKLQAEGVTVIKLIGNNIYSLYCSKPLNETELSRLGINAWAPVSPGDKINPLLKESVAAGEADKTVLVEVLPGTTRAALIKMLQPFRAKLNIAQAWSRKNIWAVAIAQDQVQYLALVNEVLFIDPQFEPQALNNQAMGFTNAQIAHQPLLSGGYSLTGEGVTIGVGDNSDPTHVDFLDRVNSFNPQVTTDHSTLTTGTTAGNGIKDERYKGYSNKSNIIADFFSQVISNGAIYRQDFNMVVSNNSYGNVLGNCGYAGTYDIYSAFTDDQMRDEPTLLHVFAAANDGDMTCSPYPQGYGTVAGSFQASKNALVVGAIGKTRLLESSYTSRGPVKDGRIKPEITAVGSILYTCIYNEGYGESSGTSLSCPNVAGGAGLLYQRYRQLHSGQDPKSALIKAILMNGASDMSTAGPDYEYGFGMMNVGHSLTALDSNRYFTNTINTAQEQTYTFTVPANTAQAKVMLYWNDPAAAPLSTATLINDLDITVTTPANTTVLPLILNSSPSQILAAAVPGADHLNNVEQVTLNNPAAGTYTIKVKGFNIPVINQEYFVTYDFIKEGVSLQYPIGSEALNSADSIRLYWEASDGTNAFTASYSTDNGANWSVINSNIPADLRSAVWYPPAGITSTQCLIRLSRNSTTQTSQSKIFTLIGRPVATLNAVAEQCPGSIKMSWNTIAGASGYRIFKKIGADMVAITDINALSYTYSGLSADSTYWVAVAPIINGTIGMRSVALNRQPNSGNCSGVAHGDLKLQSVLAPESGRKLTSTALTGNEPLTVLISNYDDQVANNYRIAYKLNNGAWVTGNYTDVINPGGNRQLTIANLNLSASGNYTLTVAVTNQAVADPVTANDTLVYQFKNIENPVMNLSGGFEETFESVNGLSSVGKGVFGIDNAEKWDFTQSNKKGRIRSYVNSGVTISGNRSISMDNAVNQLTNFAGSSYNTLTGTFNLGNYNTTNWEVRCEFDYVLHGYPKFDTGNYAWVRGSDNDPWLPLRQYDIDTNNMGVIYNSGSLSLTDILSAGGQSFSSSTQVRFTQYDTSLIAASYYGNGFTMDNFKIYLVTDDVQVISIDSVYQYNCGLSNSVPMRMTLVNSVNNTVYNIAVAYRLDNQAIVTGLIDSIPGKDTISYTFSQTMDLSANTDYNLSAWCYVATDTYRFNDSIMDMRVKNQPVVNTFPYLQDFESNNGFFFAEGNNSTWAYGTPAAIKINHAASGTKAWKTNLGGNYNKEEISYLYSPCFDISQLTKPMLSFSLASDIEPPGTSVFDVAYAEYSHDGHTWLRLGQAGQGTNWYNNDSMQVWAKPSETYWHVATTALPKDGNIISFRFVLRSDKGAEFEGLAIDDIHVFDLVNPIFDQAQFASPITQNIGGNQKVPYLENNNIAAVITAGASALGNTTVQAYKHTNFINEDSSQYFLPKNFTIKSGNNLNDSVEVWFYVTEEAMRTIREDVICYSCSKVKEVQGLGITTYVDPDKALENNLLSDNRNGVYGFIKKDKIRWVPYDKGYYAKVKVKAFSEFWFNDGGPTNDRHIASKLFTFNAAHYGPRHAKLSWLSNTDVQTSTYQLQRADAALDFKTVATLNAIHLDGHEYTYIDTPSLTGSSVFYRVKYIMDDGEEHLSLIRSLDWTGAEALVNVYPNPVRNGILNIEWFKGGGDGLGWAIYSLLGQRIVDGIIEENTFNGKKTIDIGSMGVAPGIYLLKVICNKQEWEFKIVFQ